jgi:hypothetical protein
MSGALDHSPADVVRRLLIDMSLGTLPSSSGSWPVFATMEPTTPDNAITVYDTTSTKDGRLQVSGQMQEHYGIQIRIRSANPVDGYVKASAIAVAVDETAYQNSVSISSSVYLVHALSRTGGVLALGKEVPDSKRNIFTINVLVDLRKTS